MQLSDHFSLAELTRTEVRRFADEQANPPAHVIEALRLTAAQLELVRALLGNQPIRVNSGYRSLAVNIAVGGAENSAHLHGWAVDFVCDGFGPPIDICRAIAGSGIAFDQLIEEGSWVHLSFAPTLRGEILTKHAGGGYQTGLDAPTPPKRKAGLFGGKRK